MLSLLIKHLSKLTETAARLMIRRARAAFEVVRVIRVKVIAHRNQAVFSVRRGVNALTLLRG